MNITELNTKDYPDFADHERVVRCKDEASGLTAFIAIHNSNLGPALGGCRIQPYESETAAVTDVLRLSRGMTYKSALAHLPLGGGKSVIMANAKTDKTTAMMHAMGAFIDHLDGKYIGAEDSGTTVADLVCMAEKTEHVAGIHERELVDGTIGNGDPSPSTAYGVFVGIKASLQHRFKNTSMDGVKIAVQGVGNVGRNLVKLLVDAGADVIISDSYQPAIDQVLETSKVQVVNNDEIHKLDVEVYAPCALGGALHTSSLVELTAPIIAGAANNQLADSGAGQYLFRKGTLYAPDFVINAGGIIDIYYERNGYEHTKVMAHIDRIHSTLMEIFEYSEANDLPTHTTAERLGESRFLGIDMSDVA